MSDTRRTVGAARCTDTATLRSHYDRGVSHTGVLMSAGRRGLGLWHRTPARKVFMPATLAKLIYCLSDAEKAAQSGIRKMALSCNVVEVSGWFSVVPVINIGDW